jgi:hypothetical protein
MDRPTDADSLATALEHVDYEFRMLEFCFNQFRSEPHANVERRNAFLEAFAVHARAILDFIFPTTNPKPDDMFAWHFVCNVSAFELDRGPYTDVIKQLRIRINKHVAHLTYERMRVAPKDRPWGSHGIYTDIARLITIFHKHVRKDLAARLSRPLLLPMPPGDDSTTAFSVMTMMANPDPTGENKF